MLPEFLAVFEPLYELADEAVSPTSELFHVVDVGEPSETETQHLYRIAEESVYVITNSFAYFDSAEPAVSGALDEAFYVSVLFLNPELLPEEKVDEQAAIVERIEAEYPVIDFRFSEEVLPWRGTFIDPSMAYWAGHIPGGGDGRAGL